MKLRRCASETRATPANPHMVSLHLRKTIGFLHGDPSFTIQRVKVEFFPHFAFTPRSKWGVRGLRAISVQGADDFSFGFPYPNLEPKTCFPPKNSGKPAKFLRNASYMPYMMAPDALFSRAGHFWPIFGRFWPIFGRFWPFLAHSGPIWPNLTQFGPSWPFLDHLPTIQYAGSRKSPESGQIRPESARIA